MFRRKSKQRSTDYATCKDFQQIFAEDIVGLHQLAFLLTGDSAKAEQCFIGGLEESIHGNRVFRPWARAWSRRAIIQNAIKTLAPAPQTRSTYGSSSGNSQNISTENSAANVAGCDPFERFVFVMAVLEGYSPHECSVLLACSVQEVVAAKSLALQRLAQQPCPGIPFNLSNELPWAGTFARAQVA